MKLINYTTEKQLVLVRGIRTVCKIEVEECATIWLVSITPSKNLMPIANGWRYTKKDCKTKADAIRSCIHDCQIFCN